MKTRIIALVNQKGGVGKTTTVANLGAYLASLKKKVLLIDFDPQSNLSLHFGVKVHELEKTITELLLDSNVSFKNVVMQTKIENLDLVPANIELSGAELELVNVVGREKVLKDALKGVMNRKKYDYILIDCSPSLGLLTLNALTTAREVFIPVQAEYFALQGIGRLLKTIDLIKQRVNPALEITGIVACMFNTRRRLSWEVLEKIKGFFGEKVFKTKIRINVHLAEAPGFGKSILQYSPSSYGAEDYLRLAKEVLRMDRRQLKTGSDTSGLKSGEKTVLNKQTNILIAYDETGTCNKLQQSFAKYQSTVYCVNNYLQAVKHLEQDNIHILLTDIKLPDQDGFALIKWVKNQDTLVGLPIIIMSGVITDRNSVARAMEIGVDKIVIKPFDFSKIIGDVNAFLDPVYRKNKLNKLLSGLQRRKGSLTVQERKMIEIINRKLSEVKKNTENT